MRPSATGSRRWGQHHLQERGWARGPSSGSPTRLGGVPIAWAHLAAPHPDALGVAYFGGGGSVASPNPPRCPEERVRGVRRPRGLQPPSRTSSPSAGGCASPGIPTHGRGKWEVERLYFNTPLWVGDLEKQLGEQECEVQPPPPQAGLPCRRRAQGDLYKAREEASEGCVCVGGWVWWSPGPGAAAQDLSVGTPWPRASLPWAAEGMGDG